MIANFVAHVLFNQSSKPTIADIDARVQKFVGVEIEAEMTSPSTVPMTFRIAPNGRFWAKYPTSEMFVNPRETITWMAERKEYAQAKNSEGNPCPVGFHAMWPGGAGQYKQLGETTEVEYNGKPHFALDLKGDQPYTVRLFVDPETGLPAGTKVSLQGTSYEMSYRKVTVKELKPSLLEFVPPKGSKPAGNNRPDAQLIKPGAKLPTFSGKDLNGKAIASNRLFAKSTKGMVLNFWFSSCVGCVQEMPYLTKLDPLLKRQGVQILGINPVDDVKSAIATAKKNTLSYPTLIGDSAQALKKQVSVEAYPVTVILNPKSVVVDAFMGFDEERLKSGLKQLRVKI